MSTIIVNTNEVHNEKYLGLRYEMKLRGWDDIEILGRGGSFLIQPNTVYKNGVYQPLRYAFEGHFFLWDNNPIRMLYSATSTMGSFVGIPSRVHMRGGDPGNVYFCFTDRINIQYATWPSEYTELLRDELHRSFGDLKEKLTNESKHNRAGGHT